MYHANLVYRIAINMWLIYFMVRNWIWCTRNCNIYSFHFQRPHKPSEGRKAPRKVETKAQKFQDRKHGVEFAEYADPAKLNNQISQPRPESLEATQRRPDSVPYEQKSVRTPNGPQYTQDVSRHHTNNANNNYVAQTGNHQQPPMHHNQLSPVQMRNDRASSGSIGAARPSQPPPAPPPGHLVNAAHPHHSPARDSLPPPPPPPPLGEDEDLRRYHQPSPEITRVPTTHRPSPARQDQMDLPPPPPPPPMSPEQNLPPPPPPPPVDVAVAPPPPPPPPPPMPMTNGFDDESSSTGSGSLVSAIAAPPKLKPTPKQPAVMDDRSNLLAQIRLGTRMYLIHIYSEKTAATWFQNWYFMIILYSFDVLSSIGLIRIILKFYKKLLHAHIL